MIKKLLYYFAVGLMFLCASCGRLIDDQMGFPGTVTFSKEGGEKIVKGDREEGTLSFLHRRRRSRGLVFRGCNRWILCS